MRDTTGNSNSTLEDEASGELSARQEAAIASLLLYPTVREAAKHCKIPESTLYRWMTFPLFSGALRAAKDAALGQSLSTLQSASGTAVTTLLMLMTKPKVLDSVKLGAARSLLEFALRGKEAADLDKRIAELEARLSAEEKGRS
jgi:hypothetical protein